LTTKADQM